MAQAAARRLQGNTQPSTAADFLHPHENAGHLVDPSPLGPVKRPAVPEQDARSTGNSVLIDLT